MQIGDTVAYECDRGIAIGVLVELAGEDTIIEISGGSLVRQRRQYVAVACSTCHSYAGQHAPSHNGRSWCESGSIASGGTRSHCTCNACW